VDNIKTDLVDILWGNVDYIYLAQVGENWRAIVNTVIQNSDSIKC
jgi:hypothetical protein